MQVKQDVASGGVHRSVTSFKVSPFDEDVRLTNIKGLPRVGHLHHPTYILVHSLRIISQSIRVAHLVDLIPETIHQGSCGSKGGGRIGRAQATRAGDRSLFSGRIKSMTYKIDTYRFLAKCLALLG